MKLALLLLALTMPVAAQTPTSPTTTPSTPPQTPSTTTQPPSTPAQTPATPAQPAATPATMPKPGMPTAGAGPGMVQPPPPPENHNGPAYKNPKSTLPKVAGIPHVLYTLKYIDTKIGTGPVAEPHKFYTVNYTGWFTDGTKFDSSFDHTPKEPITFPYGAQRVIIGWDTGFEGMHVGGKRRLYVPYQLAYGLLGRGPKMGPKANLIFDVELISQSDKPPTPAPGSRPPGRPMPGAPGTPGMSPGAPGTARPGAPATPPAPGAPAKPGTTPAPSTPPAAAPSVPATPSTPPAAPATPPAAPATPPAAPATPPAASSTPPSK